MNKYTIVCYATKDTPYVNILEKNLEPSVEKFKLNHLFKIVPNLRNWYKNTAYKPKFILDCLNNLNTDVVWIDSDASIIKYPSLFGEIKEDIAFHKLSWNLWYGYNSKKDTKELLTGTMYFKNIPKIKELCKEWYKKANETNEWEQKVLAKIIKNYDLSIYELPIEYIWIKTLPNGRPPLIKRDPVISHLQSSREWKRKIPILEMLNRRKK